MSKLKNLILAILTITVHSQAMPQSPAQRLCEHAYENIDLGRSMNRSGVAADKCMDTVEARINALRRDAAFLAPLDGIKFDQQVYLYMIIGGTAFAQCLAPKDVSYEEFQKTTCKSIEAALPLKQ